MLFLPRITVCSPKTAHAILPTRTLRPKIARLRNLHARVFPPNSRVGKIGVSWFSQKLRARGTRAHIAEGAHGPKRLQDDPG